MKTHDVQQGSDPWFALRLKYPLTASEAQAIGNQGKGLETLCFSKLAEKYSASAKEKYTNEHLARGVELEPQARSIYELETGYTVEVIGFVTNDKISKLCGASPDGLVGKEGLLEIKCFDDVKHFRFMVDSDCFKVEPEHVWQMQMQLLVTGRKWVDFVAFNPNYKKSILIQRIEADLEMQKKIKEGLKIGEKIIKDIEKKL